MGRRFGVVLIAIALVAAGCGDDDDQGAEGVGGTEPAGAETVEVSVDAKTGTRNRSGGHPLPP